MGALRIRGTLPLALILGLSACQTPAGAERRELLGSWSSTSLPNVTVQMTVGETARSVEGAGAWVEPTTAHGFRVSGAFAEDEVALYFDFDQRTDLTFQGVFTDDDIITGTLTGGTFRMTDFTFERDDLEKD